MRRTLGIVLTLLAAAGSAGAAGPVTDGLETFAEFASVSLVSSHQHARDLHAAAEELLYEPSAESQRIVQSVLDGALNQYLKSELYGIVAYGGMSEVQRLINPGCTSGESVMGIIADVEGNPEFTAEALYALQSGNEGDVTGFRAAQFLLNDQSWQDAEERGHAYLTALSELLVRNMNELMDKAASLSDELTADDSDDNLNRVYRAVITQSERNQALLANPDCNDDILLSRIIAGNLSGLYQLWIGQYSGDGSAALSGTGLKAVVSAEDTELANNIDINLRSLFNAARLLGNEKVRQDKDQHLAAFSARTREKVSQLLNEQGDLWSVLAGEDSP